jgi:hypothetical protein
MHFADLPYVRRCPNCAEPASKFLDGQPYADEELAEQGVNGADFVEAHVGRISERPVAKASSMEWPLFSGLKATAPSGGTSGRSPAGVIVR